MPLTEHLEGSLWFALAVGPAVFATVVVRRRYLAHLVGSAGVLAAALVATCCLAVVHLIPGALGLLSRGAVAVTSLVLAAAAYALTRRPQRPLPEPARPPAPPSGRGATVLAALSVTAVAVYTVAFLLETGGRAVTSIDALTFGIPGLAHWIQDASVWPVHFYSPGLAPGNYPQNGELVALVSVLPWRGDGFLRFAYAAYLPLSGLAVYAVARELGAPRAPAAGAGAAFAALPFGLIVALDSAKPDPLMYTTFATGVAFLLRHHRTGARTDLVLAAVGIGFAVGTKWYGLSAGAVVFVVWALARVAARHRVRTVARDFAVAAGLAALAGGFWLLRNLVESDNPFFPVRVSVLGLTIFDAPHDFRRAEMGRSLAHYLGDWGVWRHTLLPDARKLLGLPGLVAVIGVLAGLVVRPRQAVPARAAIVALTAIALGGVWLITPYTAQGPEGRPLLIAGARYVFPAVALGLALAAAAAARPRLGSAIQILLFAAVVHGLAHGDDVGQIRYFGAATELGNLALATLVTGALAATVVWLRRLQPARRTAAVLVAAACVASVGLGGVHQRRYYDNRYRGTNPVTDYVLSQAPSGASIGIAGTPIEAAPAVVPILPLYGPHYRNEVELLGRVVQHQLQRPPGQADFVAQVERRRYDYLALQHRPNRPGPENEWARSLGYRPVVRATLWDLFRRG